LMEHTFSLVRIINAPKCPPLNNNLYTVPCILALVPAVPASLSSRPLLAPIYIGVARRRPYVQLSAKRIPRLFRVQRFPMKERRQAKREARRRPHSHSHGGARAANAASGLHACRTSPPVHASPALQSQHLSRSLWLQAVLTPQRAAVAPGRRALPHAADLRIPGANAAVPAAAAGSALQPLPQVVGGVAGDACLGPRT